MNPDKLYLAIYSDEKGKKSKSLKFRLQTI